MGALHVYLGLCAVSCLEITKDEWQHRELCSGFENWLHALLFILHPVALGWAAWLWWNGVTWVIVGASVLSFGVMVHQIVWWNLR
jgi:hypothetical protein